jgi:hypothetical protein
MESLNHATLDASSDIEPFETTGATVLTIQKAENIEIPFTRLENEVIPLGTTQVELVLAEVPISSLKLDKTNPRIQYELLTREGPRTQEVLRNILWESDEVRKLMHAIDETGGLIEAIIVSGKDGTVIEGNCRATCYHMLLEKTQDPKWKNIRARILPPDVTREAIDGLLGELHISGKNHWSPFEEAFHLYKMQRKGYTHDQLLARFRMSRSYLNAKVRAYKLLSETYVPMAQKAGKEVGDLSRKWSWFEEFYKKCKPSAAGKENPERVYDGPALEQKFCQWMLNDQLPRAEDVRRLYDCLEDKKAIAMLDKGGKIDKAHVVAAATRPELVSKLWKTIEEATDRLNNIPLTELDALRGGDAVRAEKFNALLEALQKVRTEARVKR